MRSVPIILTKKQDDDYTWYTKNLAKIYKKYGEKYVVIRNREVLASFDTFDAGADYVDANNLAGKAIVQKNDSQKKEVDSLWDTGATKTCISTELAKALKLRPYAKTIINNAGGSSCSTVYRG